MTDQNINACWNFVPPPAGSSLWIPLAGKLTSAGASRYHSFPDYFCPHVILSGRGVIEVNGQRHEVGCGDLFTLWPSCEILYHDQPETPWCFHYFHLAGTDQQAYVQSLGFTREQPVFRPEQPEAVIAAFAEIWHTMQERPRGGQYAILSSLFALPGLCGREPAAANRGDTLVEHALTLIQSARTPGGANVNEICARLGVSRATLYRKFTAQLRTTPIHYIIAQRLRIARELLASSSKPVAEIARLAGFNSEKYFLKLFKQRLGVTPSACRQAAPPAAESAPLPP